MSQSLARKFFEKTNQSVIERVATIFNDLMEAIDKHLNSNSERHEIKETFYNIRSYIIKTVVEKLEIEGFNVKYSNESIIYPDDSDNKIHNVSISWDKNSKNMAESVYQKMISKIENNRIKKNAYIEKNTLKIYEHIMEKIDEVSTDGNFTLTYTLPNSYDGDDLCDNVKIKQMLKDQDFKFEEDGYHDFIITISWEF